ncbi:Phosphoglycerate dehydrogenase or related dehydrogenase [Halapricum desulfuricans]|uniref:D-3-phosphoglycerate dehydrogenase n=2 Tax=Halapricum desulfuricans TaxID=2841257 RepID=A0A897NHD3_9EURY|nr:Phosphoglycerate dehydrogenase or related dehydrogenase [Halapricum desulfuricans]
MPGGEVTSDMNVVVADAVDDAGLARLRQAGHDIELATDADREELLEIVADAHALIVRSGTTVDEELLDAAPELVVVGRAGIGIDNVDVEAATDRGVVVANAPESNVRATAEHTIALAFAAGRKIPQGHMQLKDGYWAKGDILGSEFNGKTLGVVGLGRIGQEVAKRLGNLEMDLVAYDPYLSEERARQLGAELVDDIETCFEKADFVTLHTPKTAETEHFVDEELLSKLEDGYLINCARGGIVDESALAEAVEDGTLYGAAVDVFDSEPVEPDNPLLAAENVIVTPHIAASSESAKQNVSISIADQILAAFEGDIVTNAVNAPSAGEGVYPVIRPYVKIAETAGKVAMQLLGGHVESVEITYTGDITEENVDVVTASALQGVFSPLEWQANAINAERIAEERGVEVTESKTRQVEDFNNLVTVEVSDGEHTVTVDGTQFADDDPRIVRIQGYRVEAIPHGHMLVVRNRDEPGVIGYIGSVMGESDINIAGMFNNRQSRGGEALTVYNLDSAPGEDLLDELNDDDRIIEATHISLDNGE